MVAIGAGQRFGRLLVLPAPLEGIKALVRCDCGREKRVSKYHLASGATTSCGCLVAEGQPRLALEGQRFGSWTVLQRADGRSHWLCRCDCGTERVVISNDLQYGKSTCCGCQRGSHGHTTHTTHSPTYRSWNAMKERCLNPRHTSYRRYGGRGIKVCAAWEASFEAFLRDVGERPAGRTLDRYPNPDGNYEPGNVRWATPLEQARNKSKRVTAAQLEPPSN